MKFGLEKLLTLLGAGVMLSGCPVDDGRLEGNGTGTPDDPVCWVTGRVNRSFEMKGQNNPVGFSSFYSEDQTYSVEYLDIGTFDGEIIEIPPHEDIGEDYETGIGTYLVIEGERLTPEQDPKYFEENYWLNCPEGEPTCLPVCDNGKIWGDHLNDTLDQLGGFLLDYTGVGLSDSEGRLTTYVVDCPWGGSDQYINAQLNDFSDPCFDL